MAFVQLLDGSHFDLLSPHPNAFKIEHIAHALSMINRFNGHTSRPYSVAEHSVHCADIVRRLGGSQLEQLEGLLHDRAEAYIGDITSPLKKRLGGPIKRIEERIERVSADVFGIPKVMSPIVKKADRIMLWNERRDLMAKPAFYWRVEGEPGPEIRLDMVYPWEYWKNRFLMQYEILAPCRKESLDENSYRKRNANAKKNIKVAQDFHRAPG